MDIAKKAKAGATTWMTRAANQCEQLIKSDLKTVDRVHYEAVVQNYYKRMEAWDEAQKALEAITPNIVEVIEATADYRENTEQIRTNLIIVWEKSHVVPAVVMSSVCSAQQSAKLPKLVQCAYIMHEQILLIPRFCVMVLMCICVPCQNYNCTC